MEKRTTGSTRNVLREIITMTAGSTTNSSKRDTITSAIDLNLLSTSVASTSIFERRFRAMITITSPANQKGTAVGNNDITADTGTSPSENAATYGTDITKARSGSMRSVPKPPRILTFFGRLTGT
jgi:hypothetical protein